MLKISGPAYEQFDIQPVFFIHASIAVMLLADVLPSASTGSSPFTTLSLPQVLEPEPFQSSGNTQNHQSYYPVFDDSIWSRGEELLFSCFSTPLDYFNPSMDQYNRSSRYPSRGRHLTLEPKNPFSHTAQTRPLTTSLRGFESRHDSSHSFLDPVR